MTTYTPTLCPERTEYKKFINNKDHGLDPKEYAKALKYLIQQYKESFHNYLAEVSPCLRFEIGEKKVYWKYDETDGVYKELNSTSVHEIVLKLLIDEGLRAHADDNFAKTVLARYRACYQERGNTYDDFDANDDLFHCSNGWINTKTLKFSPHTPERLSRIVSYVVYDKKAVCPVYDAFLDEQVDIPKDQIRVIDQFSGLLLTKDITKQKMLVIVGKAGCGKSTLLDAWSSVLGDMSVGKKLSELSNDMLSRFSGSDLVKKNLCWFDEVEVNRSELGNSLNTLITGQKVRVERKGINGIAQSQNTIKCVLTANVLPRSAEIGIYRRMLLIYFHHSFSENLEEKKDMVSLLQNEASGIFNRMLRGLQDLREMGDFTLIEGHNDLIEEYKSESNTVAEFLNEYFEYYEEAEPIANKVLLNTYKKFMTDNYSKNLTPRRFGRMLANSGLFEFKNILPIKSTKGMRCWSGLCLREEYQFSETRLQGEIIETGGEYRGAF